VKKRLEQFKPQALQRRDAKPRIPPPAIYLEGENGIGKTWLMEAVAADMFPMCNPTARMYMKNCNDAYYSGYQAQPVFAYDDLFPMEHFTDADRSVLGDLLRMVSKTPASLNMAAVSDKGTMFASEVVLASSNRPFNQPLPLVDPGAFCRRFFAVKCVLKDEFMGEDGRVDRDKIAQWKRDNPAE